jgi:hypothetical protein
MASRNTQEIIIRKVPLSESSKHDINKTQSFPVMPKMYLELIENKDKVKQDLVNKEYTPSTQAQLFQKPEVIPLSTRLDKLLDDYPPSESDDGSVDIDKLQSQFQYDSDSDSDKSVTLPPFQSTANQVRRSYSDNSSDSVVDEYNPSPKPFTIKSKSPIATDSDDEEEHFVRSYESRPKSLPQYDVIPEQTREYHSRREEEYYSPRRQHVTPEYEDNDYRSRHDEDYRYNSRREDDYRSRHSRRDDEYRSPPDTIKDHFGLNSTSDFNRPRSTVLPSLSELEMQGAYKKTIPNLQYMDTNMEEQDMKRELLFKFDLLRKSYKESTVTIPEFSMHSDYKEMKKQYDMTVRQLSIDSAVESYKTYLIGGFLGVEYLFGNWLGFDMQGFTQQQILKMSSYERLLIELGEKSYVDEESQWPVEIRLLGMIVVNATFFIISKMIMKKTGSNVMNMIDSMNTMGSTTRKAKRKMRAPDIDLNNLPEI